MKLFSLSLLAFALICRAEGSWYWPFGSDDAEPQAVKLRLSELVEPASTLIDEASDLAADGKKDEAIAKYREALAELDRIETENPDRATTPEFASVRNKRAYVNAAIDALLMGQVRENARAVAVTDTTELERRFEEEQAKKRGERVAPAKTAKEPEEEAKPEPAEPEAAEVGKPAETELPAAAAKVGKPVVRRALTPREQVAEDLAKGDFEAANLGVRAMLEAKPGDAVALNLKAALEAARGDLAAAETALDQAIMNHPRNYHAYFNMAALMLEKTPANKSAARRYYETGRAMGGPRDEELEALVR